MLPWRDNFKWLGVIVVIRRTMRASLLYEVVDENMADDESLSLSELNCRMSSPWDDAELAARIKATPNKDGEGFGTDVVCGERRVYRTC